VVVSSTGHLAVCNRASAALAGIGDAYAVPMSKRTLSRDRVTHPLAIARMLRDESNQLRADILSGVHRLRVLREESHQLRDAYRRFKRRHWDATQ
jgi:hypothetical protein